MVFTRSVEGSQEVGLYTIRQEYILKWAYLTRKYINKSNIIYMEETQTGKMVDHQCSALEVCSVLWKIYDFEEGILISA